MRKWNKLLALVLAMVMVFGLTATAFAEEDDKADDTTPTEATEPAEGEEDKTPAEGDDADAPADDEDAAPADDADAEPADGEDAEPADDAAPAADAYADVADWAKTQVATVVEKGLIDMAGDSFAPTANMSRADLVLALYRLAGSPANAEDATNPFTDVADDAAYKDAVIWAYSKKIVSGTSDTTFNPAGDVKRQEIAKILFVYANAENVEEDNLTKFADAGKIADWAKDYVNWAAANKVLNGKAAGEVTNMDPEGTATRQEVAVLLVNYIDNILPAASADDAAEPADDDAAPADDADAEPADDAAEGDEAPEAGDETPAGDAE